MGMEDIYLDDSLSTEIITETLESIFPGLTVFYFDFSNDEPNGFDSTNSDHIIFNYTMNNECLEFGFKISIYRTPENNSYERSLYIGYMFSKLNMVRVLAPFINPNEPDYPYFDIVFMNGESYLADDYNTSFGDGSSGLVKILEAYPLVGFCFDEKGFFLDQRSQQ